MGKTKGVILPNNTCDICGFNTKNVYIYKRHRVRCKREKTDTGPDELTKLKDTMLNSGEQPNTSSSTPLKVPDFKTSQTKDNDGESELRKNMTARVEEKSKPTYKKTYKCNQCQFTTLKSKMFLYHQIIKHKENLCIYSCMKCEYCSKVKGKIQTHMGMVHKIKIADLKEIPLEYDFKSGPPVGIKEEDVSVDLSKPTPSPTPKLIHVPRPTSSPSPKLIHVPKPSSQPSSILSSALTSAKSPSADDHIIEMNSGPGSVKYKCKYCLFNNPVKEVVASHVKTKHMNMKQFKCSQCDYTTTKKIEFIAHKAEHVNVSSDQGKILVEPTEYRCGECDYTTYSKLDYDEHKRGHDNEVMPYQCNICANPKVFGYIKPFKCSLCGHRSNWKWDLTKHMRSKHPDPNEKPFIITLSEAEARSTYKEYMAGIISPVTSAVKKLKSSMVEKEKKQREVTLKRSTYRQFKCTACPYRSNWRSDLLRHIKRKHGIARAKVQILDVEEAKQSLYEYDYKPKKNRGPFGVKKRYMSGEERRGYGQNMEMWEM
ncbi:hypothetical protein FSP39_020807 [Pinctada imbricata]|uniref:C2H2-type domain-containing protein n=1 Tax=Pinctada imbricata TaxID=66713 RepID=A0AA89BXS1_PINIB|nr:hypothetical protein FSP39_020807 [Pinctada imbricata]